LDAYAQKQQKRNVVSINWDTWQGVGMAANAAIPADLQQLRDERARRAISPAEGGEVLSRILSCSLPQIAVATRDYSQAIELWMRPSRIPELRLTSPPSLHERPELPQAYEAPVSELERALAGLWQSLLGFDRVGIHDNFFELGGHS